MLPILCFLQATAPTWLRSGAGHHEFCESRVPLGSADHLPGPQPPNPLTLGEAKRWSADVGDHAPHLAGSGETALALL